MQIIDPADQVHSNYIRKKANFCCEKCHVFFGESNYQLQCSHYFGRDNEAVRFDDDNTDSLCYICHPYFEGHHERYMKWKIKKLGQERYDALVLRANSYHKKNRKESLLLARKKLKALDHSNGDVVIENSKF